MRYLIIGDAGSMHIFNFVKTVLLPRNYEVHILTLSPQPVREVYRAFYSENGVFVHSIAGKKYRGLNKTDVFHRVLNFFRKFRLMRDVPEVDICHVHSVYKTACIMVLRNRKKFKKLIFSYWGSDVNVRTPYIIKICKKCFNYANAITVTVKESYNKFRAVYGDKYDGILRICRFATDGITCIKQLSEKTTREECRNVYNVPKGKICLTCGYNAYPAQHQDKCMEIIGTLPSSIKEKLFVIIPLQYGGTDANYILKVHKAAEFSGVEYNILEEFVPFEMSARLAVATDIYLHLRDTDAFSNALKEQVFAGSFVIKGDWLKYPELEEMRAQVNSIPSFDALGTCIMEAVENMRISDKIELFEPIFDMYSTNAIVKQWEDVIDFVRGNR